MAFEVFTDAATGVGLTSATLHGHWSGATEDEFGFSVDIRILYGFGGSATNVLGEANYATESGSHSDVVDGTSSPPMVPDRVVTVEVRGRDQDGTFINTNGTVNFKTLADDMVFGTPSMDSIGDTYAYAGVNFQAMTFESVAVLTVQSRLHAGPGAWVDGNSLGGLFGDGIYHPSLAVSGLLANTEYDLRFRAARDTANATTGESGFITFTTAAEPGHGPRVIMMG